MTIQLEMLLILRIQRKPYHHGLASPTHYHDKRHKADYLNLRICTFSHFYCINFCALYQNLPTNLKF